MGADAAEQAVRRWPLIIICDIELDEKAHLVDAAWTLDIASKIIIFSINWTEEALMAYLDNSAMSTYPLHLMIVEDVGKFLAPNDIMARPTKKIGEERNIDMTPMIPS